MMKVQLAVGAAVALLAFAAVPQAHADVYDYGYGPVYGGYSVGNGACPNGQCSGSYSPIYSATYPVHSAQSYSAQSYGPQTCPSGSCGTCPNGSCGTRGQCAGGQCSSGQCATGQCSSGGCRNGRCGTCPSGDCERGNCSGNCPNGQCTTRYRGTVDPQSLPSARNYDRPDYGPREETSYRPTYSSERPSYRDRRDYRDESVSRRSYRSDSRPLSRDSERESPFYN
jgi:hypothetical protein